MPCSLMWHSRPSLWACMHEPDLLFCFSCLFLGFSMLLSTAVSCSGSFLPPFWGNSEGLSICACCVPIQFVCCCCCFFGIANQLALARQHQADGQPPWQSPPPSTSLPTQMLPPRHYRRTSLSTMFKGTKRWPLSTSHMTTDRHGMS